MSFYGLVPDTRKGKDHSRAQKHWDKIDQEISPEVYSQHSEPYEIKFH